MIYKVETSCSVCTSDFDNKGSRRIKGCVARQNANAKHVPVSSYPGQHQVQPRKIASTHGATKRDMGSLPRHMGWVWVTGPHVRLVRGDQSLPQQHSVAYTATRRTYGRSKGPMPCCLPRRTLAFGVNADIVQEHHPCTKYLAPFL